MRIFRQGIGHAGQRTGGGVVRGHHQEIDVINNLFITVTIAVFICGSTQNREKVLPVTDFALTNQRSEKLAHGLACPHASPQLRSGKGEGKAPHRCRHSLFESGIDSGGIGT